MSGEETFASREDGHVGVEDFPTILNGPVLQRVVVAGTEAYRFSELELQLVILGRMRADGEHGGVVGEAALLDRQGVRLTRSNGLRGDGCP